MSHRDKTVVIGLGPMGGAIAARLADQAWDVIGLDLDASRVAEWGRTAVRPATSDIDAVPWSRVSRIVVALRTFPQVSAVLADDRVSTALNSGASGYIITTLAPSDARALLAREAGRRLFEVPVSGGVPRARRGDLTGLVAGPPLEPADEEFLRDVFAQTFWFDEVGQPSMVKLINNSLAAYHLLGAAVAVRAAHEQGIDAQLAHRIIATSSGSSLTGDVLPDLTSNDAELLLKDVRLLTTELGHSPFEGATFDSLTDRFAVTHELLRLADRKGTRS
ncbi:MULTISPECIES: NAD(P)-binding domain-containing protein [unclassified Nocardioides]|uniref:NAD(P)-binding domain-containing protein n=1 Tax=unclassified Nocardioides TaxID=2615069 RepID=UPI0006FF93BE|nr:MULTISPECIES: NAD(P)-binding domain-containing protein [unclassified Nocardioides]KRA29825.1 hypothetical protein ASD81_19115 [Nocardioides sp. Root614]KRA86748.1 hypothetical protein ASD84_21340 [Nocardioides sp. Root682]